MKKWIIDGKLLKQLDLPLIIAALAIAVFGVMNIYSATRASAGTSYLKTQLMFICIAIVICYVILLIDYNIMSNYSEIIYWVGIVLLLATDIQNMSVKGANSWLKLGPLPAIEPAEFFRMALALLLAKKINDMEGNINEPKNLLKLLFYTAIPTVMIIKQPNLGMAIICLCISFAILFISGLNLKIIFGTIALIVPTCIIIWESHILKPYQMARITSFLSPESAQQTTNYQLFNSKIGIGSGELLGKGFLHGTQISGGYVPEAHTDFIFAVVGEEWGLVGAVILLILYAIILYRILKIAKNSKDILGKLICVGTFGGLTFSIYQNIAMTIGLAPISGITLPLMSAGGSSIIANFMALALVLNVSMRKKKINF
ncbi:rod shape-determining protein RodA [Clostridium pasteurianum]|uniref:Rod shape-determining protein RodA n=1 Tax=Clostridium pasteurianum BC1 TaxID=86416 RepID=R4K4E6_CLOPA|nr:rod shape-determining protein RodA [Clostridium pasteurianum]AGK96576.1 rod shape-determining protein RodA [Clostridium pasteurianum BC1]